MTKEIRSIRSPELRAWGDDNAPKLTGYAAVFNRQSLDLGGFREVIMPGAFSEALAGDVRGLFNHDPNQILGRTTSGTMKLTEDDIGLRYEIQMPLTAIATHVLSAVRRKDIDGSSFSFNPVTENVRKVDGQWIRELVKVRLFDVGPVAFPAYPSTADPGVAVAVRSTDQIQPLDGDDLDLERVGFLMRMHKAGKPLDEADAKMVRDAIDRMGAALPRALRLDSALQRMQALRVSLAR